jgi:UDP-sugar pyrophosphorylase
MTTFAAINDIEQLHPEKYKPLIDILTKAGQEEILSKFDISQRNKIANFFNQVQLLEDGYPGGIVAYVNQSRKLLQASKRGDNPFEGFVPEVPSGSTLDFNSEKYNEMERIGLQNADKLAFALVAGGLGERLGFSGIKVGLPSEITTEDCYLKVYIESILALQKATNATKPLPLVIMTSDDTHSRTVSLLRQENYFGMEESQITLLKQEKVASISNDSGLIACDPNDPYKILTKPHGHGDIHYLLHSSGIAQKWLDEGRTHILFFQDTNGLVFRPLLACLGVAISSNFSANYITGTRYAKQAMGSICRLRKQDGTSITTNVEYNQLDPLLRATPGYEEGDVNGEDGFSPFPGNMNQLIFRLNDYVETLDVTKGLVPEFVNPKYADEARTKFKKPTRLECMMQDLPRMFEDKCLVGFTTIVGTGLPSSSNSSDATYARDRPIRFYSPVKNNIIDATKKQRDGMHPSCAASGEHDLYEANCKSLLAIGANVDVPVKEDRYYGIYGPYGPECIRVYPWPHVVLSPHINKTMDSLRNCFKAPKNVTITSRSTLILKGEGTIEIESLHLDGALHIEAGEGVTVIVKNLKVQNDSYEFQEVPIFVDYDEARKAMPEYILIRSYSLNKRKCMKFIVDFPGVYTL